MPFQFVDVAIGSFFLAALSMGLLLGGKAVREWIVLAQLLVGFVIVNELFPVRIREIVLNLPPSLLANQLLLVFVGIGCWVLYHDIDETWLDSLLEPVDTLAMGWGYC